MAQQSGPKPRGLIIERILRDRDSIWRQVVEERGLGREEAYILCSVAVDLKISEIVDAPNWIVSACLPETIFA